MVKVTAEGAANEKSVDMMEVHGSTDVVVAGALATDRCLAMGYTARVSRAVGIAAAELASNIARHAGAGTLEIAVTRQEVVLVATDTGPGIPDVDQALQDHFSRGRFLDDPDRPLTSLGCGLGAVARLMDRLEFNRTPEGGTVVRATKRYDRSLPWW